jgi:hypothetical protein
MNKVLDIDFRIGSLMERVSNTIGTISGTPYFIKTDKGQALNTENDNVNYYPEVAIKVLLIAVNLKSSNDTEIFNGNGTNPFGIKVVKGAYTSTVSATIKTFTKEEEGTAVKPNMFQLIVIQFDTAQVIDKIQIGFAEPCKYSHIKAFDTELTQQQLNNEYKEFLNSQMLVATKYNFLSNITFIDNFKYEPADGIIRTPQDWIKGTGDFKFTELEEDNVVLTHLKKGTRMLECVNNGTISFPSSQAYGTWEFSINSLTTSNIYYNFIYNDTTKAGYLLNYLGDRLCIRRRLGNIYHACNLVTAKNYLDAATNYSFKITRSIIGEFTVYIKGGNFGSTYVLVEAASGTNPFTDNTYTTSLSSLLNFGVGDKTTNIKYTKGIV